MPIVPHQHTQNELLNDYIMGNKLFGDSEVIMTSGNIGSIGQTILVSKHKF
jgi:hypothetical protein